MLLDNYNREINYLRLSVTDRCNLRCFYCMPEKGIDFVPRNEILTYEEMEFLIQIFTDLGITKLRITGGEPFARKDLMGFLNKISDNKNLQQISITTNGTLTEDKIDDLMKMGINSINLSLDTLDKERFYNITRRNYFDQVKSCLDSMIASDIDLKINMVVMGGLNDMDILPMIDLIKDNNISVRFLEQMPFNGTGDNFLGDFIGHVDILNRIKSCYSKLYKLEMPSGSTSENYKIPGFKGEFGIIAAFSRTFCGSCNRIRLTPQGQIQTCLYSDPNLSLRDMIRNGSSVNEIKESIIRTVNNRHKDGFEAENSRESKEWSSMASIGG